METHKRNALNGGLKYVFTVAITVIATLLFNAFMSGITLSEKVARLESTVDANAARLDVIKDNQIVVMTKLDIVMAQVKGMRAENKEK